MISVVTQESILNNFKEVIESARTTLMDNMHQEILEDIDLNEGTIVGLYTGKDYRLDEATNVTDAKIVHEKKGTAISVKINGTEYRYVSSTKSTADLYRSFMGMLKHANAGYKAINWLKKNALEYYGSKNPSEEGKKLVGLSESEQVKLESTQPADVPPATADETINPKDDKKLEESSVPGMSGKQVIRTDKTGMSYYDDFLNPKDHDYKKLVKGLQGNIVMMSPDDYIDRLGKDIFHCSRERVLRGVDQDNVEQIRQKMAAGTKYNIPILDLANTTQEGRHRALAAKALGVQKIPVLVVTKWDPAKEIGLPQWMTLFYGHSIEYTNKDGKHVMVHVGLNVDAVKKKVQEIIKSGDYRK